MYAACCGGWRQSRLLLLVKESLTVPFLCMVFSLMLPPYNMAARQSVTVTTAVAAAADAEATRGGFIHATSRQPPEGGRGQPKGQSV